MLRDRYRRIVFFFARVLISLGFWEVVLPRLGFRRLSARGREERFRRAAVQFRAMAIRLGGVMIKVGQFLSTRVDVLPEVVTLELSGLQDEVPPENFEDLRRVAELEFRMKLEEKFAWFDIVPLAAASLGQAHQARLRPEEGDPEEDHLLDVVVKIQRPGIEKLIATDLAALQTVGKWLNRYRPISRRADIPALLGEFSKILYEEIDYLAEGEHAETFAKNFKDNPRICVPEVVWSHTTKRVLTLEDVGGIKITDYEKITEAGIDLAEVADLLLDTYLTQIFEYGFFHADPHPGNLFVRVVGQQDGGKTDWSLTFVDFGMVGHIPAKTRLGLREMLVAVGTKDAARVVKSYQMLGVLLPSADLDLLERAGERMFEQFWGKNMTELRDVSPGQVTKLANEFRELLYEMPFQIPQDFIFLGRTVGILSGMCTGLNPSFNVWDHLAPYAKELIRAEAGSGMDFWLKELGRIAEKLFALPRRTEAILERVEKGELVVKDVVLAEQVRHLERAVLRAGGSVVSAALILGGVQLYLGGESTLAKLFWTAAALILLWVGLGKRRMKS